MSFLEPLWLLLFLPLAWLLASRRLGRWRRLLRWLVFSLLILALARPALRLPRTGGTVVAVVDRSASMPDGAELRARQAIERLSRTRGPRDRLAVVTFAERSAVESEDTVQAPESFVQQVGSAQSLLAEGLETALALLPSEGGRLLVVSDGRWTGPEPRGVVARAAYGGVAIDYHLLERTMSGDVAVERIEAPIEVTPGEGFVIDAWIHRSEPGEVAYQLSRGAQVLASGRRWLDAGRQRLSFHDRARGPGVEGYRLTVTAIDGNGALVGDEVPENDTARFLVSTRGPRPVLVLSPRPGLAELLRAGGLDIRHRRPEEVAGSLEELAGYSAVVLENVAVDTVGKHAVDTLAAWVSGAGGGLLITGGEQSYGPGGYFRSALDPILPVSMEMRQEQRQLSLAVAIALDRSGSMSVSVDSFHTKMDLANLASVEVLDLLGRDDELAVLAVDSAAHRIQPLVGLTSGVEAIRQTILSIDSRGGGIYVYEALEAALGELLRARAPIRHILLFADAADAENPAQYEDLLREAGEAGITVSVVGLGSPGDSDADLLRDIAELGGGRIFFTNSPHELPRIFAQDTFVVARRSFVEEVTPWRFTSGRELIGGPDPGRPQDLGGFNLTYLRPGATLVAVTADDHEAPVVAAWQSGLGRVVAYTGEVDGTHLGALAEWDELGPFLTGLVRWVAGRGGASDAAMVARLELEHGAARLRLHLDPERLDDPFDAPPRVSILRGTPGAAPRDEALDLDWSDPDTLSATLELVGEEVALATVGLPGGGVLDLPPIRLPYSPEMAPDEPGRGSRELESLARRTGGRQRFDLANLWNDLPRHPRRVELTPVLLLAAIVGFLLEILERRTGWLSVLWARHLSRSRTRERAVRGGETAVAEALRPGVTLGPTEPPAVIQSPGPTPPEPESPGDEGKASGKARGKAEPEPSPEGVGSALAQARARARRRQR